MPDYRKVKRVDFREKQKSLKAKYKKLLQKPEITNVQSTVVKSAVLNLTGNPMSADQMELLNLGPKFVPVQQKVPFMDIITSTETAAVELDKNNKIFEFETLRQQVSSTLLKFINKKIPSNLTCKQRQALKELKDRSDTKIYQFDKGSGFAILNKDDAIAKIQDQLGEARLTNNDPTKSLTKKFQSTLSAIRKEEKLSNKLYYEMYLMRFLHKCMAC